MMKNLKHKDILLISLIVLSQLHVLFRGLEVRVDWYLLSENTRRIDYAVMYLCRYIIQFILAYCVLFPAKISRDVRLLVFVISIFDLIHYLTLSSIGFEKEKILISTLFFYLIKKIKYV